MVLNPAVLCCLYVSLFFAPALPAGIPVLPHWRAGCSHLLLPAQARISRTLLSAAAAGTVEVVAPGWLEKVSQALSAEKSVYTRTCGEEGKGRGEDQRGGTGDFWGGV